MEKTKLLLVMSIAATMVCQPLMAQNEAVASEQENEGVQYLIIDKTDCKTGSVEDTIEFSYVYKNVEPDKATHATQTIKHQDTTIIQIINLSTQKVIDEDVYVRDSLIYNRLYNEAGDSVQVTSYKNPSIKHYQQGRLVRQYKYRGNKRYAVLCYPEGSIMCTYTTDADIQYYTRTGLKTKPTKPIRLVSDSLLRKALTRMFTKNNQNILMKDFPIEINIDAKGHMVGWSYIPTKEDSDSHNDSTFLNLSTIPFTWEPANVDGFGLIGYDTISIGVKDFNELQYKKGLTFPQLPQDGDLFYVHTTKIESSPIDNPFVLEDTTQYIWSATLQLEPNGKNYETATVKRNGNSIYFEWTNQDGKKFKEEKYAVLDSHTLLLLEEVYFDHDDFTRINQFDQGDLASSVRINAVGDTLSVWRWINRKTYSEIYKYNINPYIQFVKQTGSEYNIEYRDKTIQDIVRPRIKDLDKCNIIIPDSLKNLNKIITVEEGISIEIRYTFEDIILYACAMIGEDGAPIGDYELGFKSKHDWNWSNLYEVLIYDKELALKAKVIDIYFQRKKQILQYVQNELSKSTIEFIPGRIDNNVATLPYVFTLTLKADPSRVSKSLPTKNTSYKNNFVFAAAEQTPEFPGGQQAMDEYLNQKIHYPADAKKNHLQGRVTCQFVVNTNGSIEDIEVVNSSGHPSLDQEAIRVIKSMPQWKPGSWRGFPVPVRYTVPINFHL